LVTTGAVRMGFVENAFRQTVELYAGGGNAAMDAWMGCVCALAARNINKQNINK